MCTVILITMNLKIKINSKLSIIRFAACTQLANWLYIALKKLKHTSVFKSANYISLFSKATYWRILALEPCCNCLLCFIDTFFYKTMECKSAFRHVQQLFLEIYFIDQLTVLKWQMTLSFYLNP